MLKFRTLELQDVGVFSGPRSFDLSGRLIGIVGSNGRGKSTILSLLHYCITGEYTRAGHSDSVALRRASSDQPFGRLVFEADGEAVSITRWIPDGTRTGKRRLVAADQSWTSVDDVSERIGRWTGVPAKILSEFVFVEQGRLAAVVEDRPSERAKTLQRLFGVDEAERVRGEIADHLSTLPAAIDSEMLAMLRVRYVEAETAYGEARRRLEAMPAAPEQVADWRSVVSEYAAQEQLRSSVERINGRIGMCREILDRPEVEEPDPRDVPNLNAMLDEWRGHDLALAKVSRLTDQINLLRCDIDKIAAVVATSEPVRPEPPAKLGSLLDRKFALETIAAAPDCGGECPVCRGNLSPDLADRDRAKSELHWMKTMLEAHNIELDRYEEAVDKQRGRREEINSRRRLLEKLSSELESTSIPTPPNISSQQVNILLEVHRRRVAEYAADVENRLKAKDQLVDAQADLEKVEDLLAERPVSAEDDCRARELLAVHDAAEAERREASARVEVLQQAFESARQLLEKAEASGAQSERIDRHRARAAAVRDLLHRDAAPARSVKGCLDSLSHDLNSALAALKARFRVSVRHDGELMAEFRDGTSTSTIRANRISKGERAVLGLAWTISAAQRYAPNVGVLCLDEPTEGLDRERVGALRSAFQAWTESDFARQCIVVTHERSLMGVFDRVIDLG